MAKIDADVLEVLRGVECDGTQARLTAQLDRKLYERVNKVLVALGGKWNRKSKAHVFECETAELLADVVATGEYVDWKKELQFYETPEPLAAWMCQLAEAGEGAAVLEPSAGRGAIAKQARGIGAKVDCIEIAPKFADELQTLGFKTTCGDFLQQQPNGVWYDAVTMNPPFCKSQDLAHVRHAYQFLREGGRLVSVMSPGFTFRSDRKAVEFRAWLDDCGGEVTPLAPGTFKASGTMVSSVLVKIRK